MNYKNYRQRFVRKADGALGGSIGDPKPTDKNYISTVDSSMLEELDANETVTATQDEYTRHTYRITGQTGLSDSYTMRSRMNSSPETANERAWQLRVGWSFGFSHISSHHLLTTKPEHTSHDYYYPNYYAALKQVTYPTGLQIRSVLPFSIYCAKWEITCLFNS